MNRILFSGSLFVFALLSFASCSVDVDPTIAPNVINIDVNASLPGDSKSTFGDVDNKKYHSSWSGNETVAFSLNGATVVSANATSAGQSTAFSVSFASDNSTSGNVYAVSPYNSNSTGGAISINNSYTCFNVVIPSTQTPLVNSCDEKAHILYGEYSYDESLPSAISMPFHNIAAYGKIKLNNLNVEISSLSISFPSQIFGQFYYYYADCSSKGYSKGEFAPCSGKTSYTLTIDPKNVENNIFWFGCAPAELSSGNIIISYVAKETSTTYTKTIKLSDSKKVIFESGKVSPITVDMSVIDTDDPVTLPFEDDFSWVTNSSSSDVSIAYTTTTARVCGSPAYYNIAYSYPAGNGGALKLSNSNYSGCIVTPKMNLSGAFTINVTAKTFNKDDSSIAVYLDDNSTPLCTISGLSDTYVNYQNGVTANTGTSESRLKFVSTNRSYIDFLSIESGTESIVPVVVASDISEVSGDGVTDNTSSFSVLNQLDWTLTVSCDGTVVTSASANADTGVLTYTVSKNTSSDARQGSITFTFKKSGKEDVVKVITVSQLAGGDNTKTYVHAFTAKPSTTSSNNLSGIKWTVSNATNLGSYNSSNYAGVQIGTKSASGSVTFTTDSEWGSQSGSDYEGYTTVKEVHVWMNAGTGTPSATVTIGGTAATSNGTTVTKNSSASTYEDATKVVFTPATDANKGVISITVSTPSKAGYICAIEVICSK